MKQVQFLPCSHEQPFDDASAAVNQSMKARQQCIQPKLDHTSCRATVCLETEKITTGNERCPAQVHTGSITNNSYSHWLPKIPTSLRQVWEVVINLPMLLSFDRGHGTPRNRNSHGPFTRNRHARFVRLLRATICALGSGRGVKFLMVTTRKCIMSRLQILPTNRSHGCVHISMPATAAVISHIAANTPTDFLNDLGLLQFHRVHTDFLPV